MKSEEGESSPDSPQPKKKKRFPHTHIGPYAKAYRHGVALCPVCDAEKIHRTIETDKSRRS